MSKEKTKMYQKPAFWIFMILLVIIIGLVIAICVCLNKVESVRGETCIKSFTYDEKSPFSADMIGTFEFQLSRSYQDHIVLGVIVKDPKTGFAFTIPILTPAVVLPNGDVKFSSQLMTTGDISKEVFEMMNSQNSHLDINLVVTQDHTIPSEYFTRLNTLISSEYRTIEELIKAMDDFTVYLKENKDLLKGAIILMENLGYKLGMDYQRMKPYLKYTNQTIENLTYILNKNNDWADTKVSDKKETDPSEKEGENPNNTETPISNNIKSLNKEEILKKFNVTQIKVSSNIFLDSDSIKLDIEKANEIWATD